MSVHFNLKRLRPNLDGLGFLIDVGMILLVIANLSLILFDWIYRVEAVQSAMETYTPDFYRFYSDSIHANFFEIDLAFVSVYLTEFVIRWAAAIARQTRQARQEVVVLWQTEGSSPPRRGRDNPGAEAGATERKGGHGPSRGWLCASPAREER